MKPDLTDGLGRQAIRPPTPLRESVPSCEPHPTLAGETMNKKFLLLSDDRTLLSSLCAALGDSGPIRQLSAIKAAEDIALDRDAILGLLWECSYRCSLRTCGLKMSIFAQIPEVPLIILRRAAFCSPFDTTYFITVYSRAELTSLQAMYLSRIKSSSLYALSPHRYIHPANPFFKLLRVQSAITECQDHQTSASLSTLIKASYPWLSANFRKICGIKLSDLTRINKLCTALWKVISTDRPIKAIAYESGSGRSAFNGGFGRQFGCTPVSIRKMRIDSWGE